MAVASQDVDDRTALEPLVEVEGVTKRFPGVLALDEANLTIRRGEVHALVGENGAGKSTLIKLLNGVHRPDEGAIRVGGETVEISDPRQAQSLGISTIYQEHTLAPDLSPIENVFLGREARRTVAGRHGPFLDEGMMRARALELWSEFGGEAGDLDRPVPELGGLKQRLLEIIKALAFDADLVIMDEPTAALPDEERDNLLEHIRRMRRTGVSVLLVTHRLEELFAVADRITVFRDGRSVDTVAAADTSIDEVIRKMVGRDITSLAGAAAAVRNEANGVDRASRREEILRVSGMRRRGVLHGVDLVVHASEIVGIAGLAGSGRTELARAIVGADRVDGGEVVLRGRTVRFRSPSEALRAGIVLVPEERKTQGIVSGFSVTRNITVGALWKVSRARTFLQPRREQRIARRYVEQLRIKTRGIGERIENLSGGNQQKVLFARALFAEPSLVIFDEPTQGIDVGAKQEVYRLIREFVAGGGAALVISSELPELLGLTDRIVVLGEGAKRGEVPVSAGVADTPELAEQIQQEIMQMATGASHGRRH